MDDVFVSGDSVEIEFYGISEMSLDVHGYRVFPSNIGIATQSDKILQSMKPPRLPRSHLMIPWLGCSLFQAVVVDANLDLLLFILHDFFSY